MARQGMVGGKRDRLLTNNLIINGKENTQLSTKLASLEIQQRKEMARWEREKNKLSLPSIKTNCERVSLTPPPSPAASPIPSPVLRRRRSDMPITTAARSGESVSKVERPRGSDQISFRNDVIGLRRSKSSQNIRLSEGPQPSRGPVSASPKILNKRTTMDQASLHGEENASRQSSTERRFSAGVVPSIRVEDSSETLNEKVKKFNESLQKGSKEAKQVQVKTNTHPAEDDRPTADELSIPPRPLAHRWKSLPSIFPVSVSDEKSSEEMTFYEDMKRCRYLRIPDLPALSIEQIFDKTPTQTSKN